MITKSKNPCPLCGGKEWDVLIIDGSVAKSVGCEVFALVDCSPLFDPNPRQCIAVDECVKCGAVAS